MFSAGKNAVLRVIAEPGEALANYQRKEFWNWTSNGNTSAFTASASAKRKKGDYWGFIVRASSR